MNHIKFKLCPRLTSHDLKIILFVFSVNTLLLFINIQKLFFCIVDHSVRKLSQQGNRARCASHGVWKPPVIWTRQIWWPKSNVSLILTAVTTNNARSFCYSVSMVTRMKARWCTGKWRSVSCLDYHWTVSDSNGFQDLRLPSRTLHRRLPMSCSYNICPWFIHLNVFIRDHLKELGNRDEEGSIEFQWCVSVEWNTWKSVVLLKSVEIHHTS